MKKLITLLTITIVFANISIGQNSEFTCTAPDNIVKRYLTDANRLALRRINDENLTYTDSINIPKPYVDTFLNALLAVYNLPNSEARNTVVDILQIHTNMDPAVNMLNITANSSLNWMQQLENGIIPTGNTTIDSLLDLYHLHVVNYSSFISFDRVTFISDSNYNIQELANVFDTITDIYTSNPTHFAGDGADIVAAIYPDYVRLIYKFGWEDCLSGCIYWHYWIFNVYYDCSVQNEGSIGSPIPSSYLVIPELTSEIEITSDYNGEDISCYSASDGIAQITPEGGITPYSYLWDSDTNEQTTQEASGLSSGTHYVTVTDAIGCSIVDSVTLEGPEELFSSTSGTSDYNGEDISCYGFSDGSAMVESTGGTGAYTYQWDAASGNQTTQEATGLSASTYYVTVTDVNGCSIVDNISMSYPPQLEIDVYIANEITCYGFSDGEIHVNIEGGTIDYTIDWEVGQEITSETSYPITGLSSGLYDIVVTDINGCVKDTTIELEDPVPPSQPVLNDTAVIICEGDSHEITATGTGAIQYNVYDSLIGGTLLGTTPLVVSPVVTTFYYVEAKNEDGCIQLDERSSVAITVNPAPSAPVVTTDEVSICLGDVYNIVAESDPTATVNVYDTESADSIIGTSPYEVSHDSSQIYYLQSVSDAGCTHLGDLETVHVIVNYYPVLDVWVSDTVLYLGETSEISATGANIYEWVPKGELSCDYCTNPVFTAPSTQAGDEVFEFILEATSNGCTLQDTLIIRVKGDIELKIPEGFSPNDDGIGDTWNIYGLARYPGNELQIFNRWGNIVYSTHGYEGLWRGTNQDGDQLPSGTYYYVLKLHDKHNTEYKGFVYIKL